MNKFLSFGIIFLLLVGCMQDSKTGLVGQQFVLKADVPEEVGSFDYIWKITDLPEDSGLMLSDLQFSEDESQAIFIPDVAGHFTLQVTIWKYNDKLGAFVYNYDISDTATEVTAQQQSQDEWLDETVEEPILLQEVESSSETEMNKIEEIPVSEPVKDTAHKEKSEEPAVTASQAVITPELTYTIQVGADSDIDNAMQLVNRLINDGYEAYTLEHTTSTGQILYRIRVGKFSTRNLAVETSEKLENDHGLSSWITTY